jgi:hypothetical protein
VRRRFGTTFSAKNAARLSAATEFKHEDAKSTKFTKNRRGKEVVGGGKTLSGKREFGVEDGGGGLARERVVDDGVSDGGLGVHYFLL